MDAITLAGSFATMVGLLVSFQSIRDEANINEFLEWLRENNNENTAMIIENDIELQRQLSVFINQNHTEVMAQLSILNNLMVSVASRMDGLSGLASTFKLNNGLSAQAIDVLRQFVNSNSKSMYRCETTDGRVDYLLIGSTSIEYDESRFIDDDVQNLVDNKLITKKALSSSNFSYGITRQAVVFIESLKSDI
ncbi:hypothetical protein NK638_00460 [Psychrobacter sp. A3]|uniref:hypothetical protein n=1 Tax=Psychrobacter sp. A3 TaxID=2992754 RepID=UPI00237B9ED3|nr:hypothetical protein [Psychrobacter sp. A3]MDE0490030.1 hypothetical protein [Psychrobacter sp. A3]